MPSLIAILGLDASGFKGGLEAARLHADRAGTRIGRQLSGRIASFLSAGAVSAAVKHTIDWAGKLQDVGDALGVSVEWLQKMQNGAATAGGKIEDLEKSMIALNQAREDALRKPAGENAKALGRMGFSQGDIASLPAEAFYDRMVKLFANGGSAQLQNDVVQVGGKSAKNLLAAFANQFQSSVPIVSAAMVQSLDDLGDKFTIFRQNLTVGLAPAIVFTVEKLGEFINWIKRVGAAAGGGSTNIKPQDALLMAGGVIGMTKFVRKLFESDESAQAMLTEQKNQDKEAEIAKALKDARDAARADARNKAPFSLDQIALEELKPGKGKPSASGSPMHLNALQQIGGYAALPPGEVQMHNHVAQIARHVSDIARKGSDGVNY